MPADSTPIPVATDAAPAPEAGERQRLWTETVAVTAVVFVPWLAIALRDWGRGSSAAREWTAWSAAYRLLSEGSVVALPLLFIGMSREGWEAFGLKRFRLVRDMGLGMLVCLLDLGLDRFADLVFPNSPHNAWHSWGGTAPAARIIGVLAIVASAFVQELVFRSWLMTRLGSLTGSRILALIVSSALFASFHVYQSPHGVFHAALAGLLLGSVFLLSKRLWPCVISHSAYNLCIFAMFGR